jgi:hypothetical protein
VGLPAYPRHLGNVVQAARKAAQTPGCLGHVVTSWAVRHNHPECHWPMNLAAARAARDPADTPAASHWQAFAMSCLGANVPGLGEALSAVSEAVPFSEAARIEQAQACLARGGDPAAELRSKTPNLPEVLLRVRRVRAACDPAARLLRRLPCADPAGARLAGFLIEGIELTAFHADFAMAALEGRLRDEAVALRERLETQRAATAALFAETDHPLSVQEELAVRYGLHENWLARVAGGEREP